ncbi:MAG: hypothetical protein AB1532_07520 [Pseudomonadota bacterium]
MDDRELLILAAKVARYVEWDGDDVLSMCCPTRSGSFKPWRPLEDEGDALRLAITLRLDVFFFEGFKEVHSSHCMIGESETWERYGDDPFAATCRAIVRAAAEMAKTPEVAGE